MLEKKELLFCVVVILRFSKQACGKTVNRTPTREVQARYSTVELFSLFAGVGKIWTCAELPLTDLQSVALDHSATTPKWNVGGYWESNPEPRIHNSIFSH